MDLVPFQGYIHMKIIARTNRIVQFYIRVWTCTEPGPSVIRRNSKGKCVIKNDNAELQQTQFRGHSTKTKYGLSTHGEGHGKGGNNLSTRTNSVTGCTDVYGSTLVVLWFESNISMCYCRMSMGVKWCRWCYQFS